MFLNPYCHLVIATNKEKVSLSVLHPSLKFLSLSESLTWQSLKLEEIISKSSASPPTRGKKKKKKPAGGSTSRSIKKEKRAGSLSLR